MQKAVWGLLLPLICNVYNSTTNILAHKRSSEGSKGRFHDTLAGLPGMDDAAPDGKSLSMTVDGVNTPIAPGSYTGKIVLTVA